MRLILSVSTLFSSCMYIPGKPTFSTSRDSIKKAANVFSSSLSCLSEWGRTTQSAYCLYLHCNPVVRLFQWGGRCPYRCSNTRALSRTFFRSMFSSSSFINSDSGSLIHTDNSGTLRSTTVGNGCLDLLGRHAYRDWYHCCDSLMEAVWK